jgi:HEAT repeat protein
MGPAESEAVPPPEAENPTVAQNIELLASKDDGVRFAAAIELGRLGDLRAVPALVKGLREDPDVFVRSACSRALGDLKAYKAFLDLVEAMSDGEEYVSKRAALVVKEFSGEDFGYKQGQTKSDRKRVADRARKWWEDNKQNY